MATVFARRRRSWNRRKVLRELRLVVRKGLRVTQRDLQNAGRFDLVGAIRRYFKNYRQVRRLVGAPEPLGRKVWNRDRVITEVRTLAVRGIRITRPGLLGAGCPNLAEAVVRYFGSWNQARRAAGIPKPQASLRWPRERVVREIRRRHRAGEVVARVGVPKNLYAAGLARFGSWRAAVAAAGLDYERVRLRVRTRALLPSRAKTLAGLRELERRLDRPLTGQLLQREASLLYRAGLHHFGGVVAARRAAGLRRPRYGRRWTRQVLADELVRMHGAGQRITYGDLLDARRYDLIGAIRTVAGGINRARDLAGIPRPPRRVRDREQWDAARVIREIRRRRAGSEPLASSRVPRSLRAAAIVHLGSWRQAIEAAGLRYEDVCLARRYGDRDLVRMLRSLARERPNMTLDELHHHRQSGTLRGRFGSLEAAARRAGLRGWPRRTRGRVPLPSKAQTVRRLRALLRRRGRLRYDAVASDDALLLRACERHFGTFRAAVLAATGVRVRPG